MSTSPEKPFKSNELNQAYNALATIEKLIDKVNDEARKMAGFSEGMKFQSLPEVKITLPRFESLRNPSSGWSYSREASYDEVEKNALEALAVAKAVVAQAKIDHAPIIAANKKIAETLYQIMAQVGIPASYTTYEFPTARSKTRKTISHTAGFIGDISRTASLRSPAEAHDYALANYERDLKNYLARGRSIEAAEKEKNRSDSLTKLVTEHSSLIVDLAAYGIDFVALVKESTHLRPAREAAAVAKEKLDDLLEAALEKNKYVRLAYFLELNREDWNDGPTSAAQGLNGFTAETEEDEAIVETLSALIEDWDGDGRVFRDCKYGYDFLYSKNEAIASEVAKLKNLINKLELL